MNWALVVVIGYMAANALYVVSKIGKPRPDYTAGDGVVAVVFTTIFIALMIWAVNW